MSQGVLFKKPPTVLLLQHHNQSHPPSETDTHLLGRKTAVINDVYLLMKETKNFKDDDYEL